jgi:hypothetical protein
MAPRKVSAAARNVNVARLLDVLRDLEAHPMTLSSELAAHAGVEICTLQRLLTSAERDLGVIVGAVRNPGGMWIEDWGVLDRRRVLRRRKR